MAFVKLDCGILNSTLWVEREPRDIFITALLMAHPFEVTAPLPQFKVDSIEETGFVVPPGWYGFVEAAGPGIVRRAIADPVLGMQALAKLGEPDYESRSSSFNGRRLVRVDGGYIVLNYMTYRDKDNTAAVRQQRYRQRKREAENGGESRVTASRSRRDCDAGVTIAEAEAEAEEEKYIVPTGLLVPAEAAGTPYRPPACPHQDLVDTYHRLCPSMSRVVVLTDARKQHTKARWLQVCVDEKLDKVKAIAWFADYFEAAEASDFLAGRAGNDQRPWRADFQWLMTAGNFAKVLEGKYVNGTRRKK